MEIGNEEYIVTEGGAAAKVNPVLIRLSKLTNEWYEDNSGGHPGLTHKANKRRHVMLLNLSGENYYQPDQIRKKLAALGITQKQYILDKQSPHNIPNRTVNKPTTHLFGTRRPDPIVISSPTSVSSSASSSASSAPSIHSHASPGTSDLTDDDPEQLL